MTGKELRMTGKELGMTGEERREDSGGAKG